MAVPGFSATVGLDTLDFDDMRTRRVVDFVAAFVVGTVFRHFAIAPMISQSTGHALWQALKADTLSITSWQVGM